MPRHKCVTDDTEAGVPAPHPKVGSLIEVEFVQGLQRRGIVIHVRDAATLGKGDVPWLTVLFNDGKKEIIKTPDIRVINMRRRRKSA